MTPKFELTSGGVSLWNGKGAPKRTIIVPNVTITKYIGRGAHGFVFAAEDNLGRNVAVKIWYRYVPGTVDRAREEMRKVAQLEGKTGIANVYSFGTIDETPYAVMELIKGQSATDWLKSETQPLLARLAVWSGYSQVMKEIHSSDLLHGDPHTGNFFKMIGEDQNSDTSLDMLKWSPFIPHAPVKMIDLGSSLLWQKRDKFAERERIVIIETAERLLGFEIHQILEVNLLFNHKTALHAADQFAIFLLFKELFRANPEDVLSDSGWFRIEKLGWLAESMLNCPIFRLETAFEALGLSVEKSNKFLPRLLAGCIERNEKLVGFADVPAQASFEKVEPHYQKLREQFLRR